MNFVTVFLPIFDVIVTKDVGVIPALLQKKYGYDAKIVCYAKPEDLPLRDKYFPALGIESVPNRGSEFRDEFRYIRKNAKKIDVLNMYHMTPGRLLCLNLYKILNPKGKAFLKLDLDLPACEAHAKMAKWKRRIIKRLHKRVDIVSAESHYVQDFYEKIYGVRPAYIPNGYYDFTEVSRELCEKEKIILTVGRLGIKQKATDMLLESFLHIKDSLKDWKLICVGPVHPSFQPQVDAFFEKHPECKEQIRFTGEISDKEELSTYYRRASIFVLPSRWESFAIVLSEAISFGCYVVSTDSPPNLPEITNNFKYGIKTPIDDAYGFAEGIKKAAEIVSQGNVSQEEMVRYAEETFQWENICDDIYKMISS